MQETAVFDKEGVRMSMFKDWMRRRNLREGLADSGEPMDGFKLNSDDNDFAADHEHIQKELFKTILTKYPDETMQFLNGIAQRGDEEVANLLSKMRREKKTQFKEPKHPTDGDEVVPSGADSGYNNEFGGDS